MNEYRVGSIADLISQSKGIKIKSNKKKHKHEQILAANEKNTDKPVVKKQKSKQKTSLKKPSSKADNPVSNLEKTRADKTTKTNKKRKNTESDILESKKVLNKKRKKSLNEASESLETKHHLNYEKPQMGIDLNFMPSDSEGEENKSKEKNTKTKPEVSNQKREYKDFTECTIFVGNIPINYDKQKISKMFSKFGKIKSARIRCVPIADINISKKVAAIKKQFNSKRNSLVAYVKYENQDSANAALTANGMVVNGHHLRVDLAEKSNEIDNKKAVFVGGLPFDIEDDELWEFFQNCGKINSVRIIRDSRTSMGKGFGYVNFDSTGAVELALQMNGQELKKRAINVKRCVARRCKNKMNAFGKNKSKEMTDQLLGKKGKKFKGENKKKDKKSQVFGAFQGRKANVKQKKKKKLSEVALRQKKLAKILAPSKG